MKRQRQNGLSIERYAVLTENMPELRGKLEEWHGFYLPATPGECEQLDMAVMASVLQRRTIECLTATASQQVRTAVFQYDCDQEDEVQYFRDLLETQPGVAVVGLKRSALGARFLICRWERLLRLLHEEGTLYGRDRDEAIHYQGARAIEPENMHESEGAYLTWLYCLMCQPAPKDAHFVAMGNPSWRPVGLEDRKIHHWLGETELCRKLLLELVESELAQLRKREAILRTNYEIPARDGVEIRKQVVASPLGAQLVRQIEIHDRQFHRSYSAFLKGRAQSAKSGRLPGEPEVDLHGVADDSAATAAPDSVAVEQGVARRKQAADAVAPGGENGIGAQTCRGDNYRAGVMASGPLSGEELDARARAAAEASGDGSPGA